jgi:hypothetical protein
LKDTFVFTPAQIGLPSSTVEDYTGEHFTGDGSHFIGSDDFVVPNCFTEFLDRYPVYVRNWVSKKRRQVSNHPDVEDWTNTLLMHLCQVPQGREIPATETEAARIVGGKYAVLGFSDVIQAFNPWGHYGASAKRFFNFINKCLNNKYLSLNSKHRKDAMAHQGFSLDDGGDVSGGEEARSREYLLMERSSFYAQEVGQEVPQTGDRILVQQFREFLSKRDPELVPLANALMTKDRIEEILVELDIDHNAFLRSRKRLMRLSRIFTGAK